MEMESANAIVPVILEYHVIQLATIMVNVILMAAVYVISTWVIKVTSVM